MKDKGILVVVSGFSGAGKGTLMKRLVSEYDNYALSVSMTTRPMRPEEEEGVSYFFVDRAEFERTIATGGLVEYAVYCDHYYGTPKDWVLKQLQAGRDVILEIEIQGAQKIREQFPDALLLFVMPPSMEELRRRLTRRGTEPQDVIDSRLRRAAQEAEGIETYDFIVINDDLEECAAQMHAIIQAAHLRPGCRSAFIEEIRQELKEIVGGEK